MSNNDDPDQVYGLVLVASGSERAFEDLSAGSEEDAIELTRLRLLFGRDLSEISLWAETRLIVTFRRDDLLGPWQVVP